MTAKHALAKARLHAATLAAGSVLCALLVLTGVFSSWVQTVSAAAGQILKLETSDGGTTFYIGRCFRTNILVQTDSLDANSADVIIPYNGAYMAPYTNSGCTVAASALNTDGLFSSYPSNTISSGRIEVTGYDPSGSSPVNTGAAPADDLFGHIYWKVLAASGSVQLGFDFTLSSTIDTNMAEDDGDGTDVLDAVEEPSLVFAADATGPTFTNLSPASGATDVSVTSDLSFTVNDAGAGVDSSSITVTLNGDNQSVSVGSCVTTNSNRIASCDVTVNLSTLSYNTTYTIVATASDLATTPNSGSETWSFTTEDDDDPPYVEDLDPAADAVGVALDDNIVFHIKDFKDNGGTVPGLGVDLDTVFVTVTIGSNAPVTYDVNDAEFSSSGIAANRTITINPATNFPQNTVVQVSIEASDEHSPANAMDTFSYQFTTIDSDAPVLSNFSPAQSATDIVADTNISFTVSDDDAGVDLDNTSITIEGVTYTNASPQWSATGNTGSSTITINPSTNFSGGQVVDVSISTRDLASTPNTASATYTFTIASSCDTCSVDTESPARFTTDAALSDTISFHVKDTGDGIDSDTITVTIVGSGDAVPVNPLTLTGASAQMTITGTSADYTVTITLAAAISANIAYSVTIDASNINGLTMSTVSYTFMKSTGTTTTVAAACPVCEECSSTTITSGGGSNRLNENTVRNITSADMPIIIARRRIPGQEAPVEEILDDERARFVDRCYIDDPAHASAPEPQTHYEDLPAGAWYEPAAAALLEQGVLDSSQTLFRGVDPAIRAEVAKMLVLLSGEERLAAPQTSSFTDVTVNAWYFSYVEEAAQRSWMLGDDDCYGRDSCTTRPGARVTRAEAAAMIVRSFGILPSDDAPDFADVPQDAWFADEMQAAADHCIVQGMAGTAYAEPAGIVNRAEIVAMLYRAGSSLSYALDCPRRSEPGNPLAGSLTANAGKQAGNLGILAMVSICALAIEYKLRFLRNARSQ